MANTSISNLSAGAAVSATDLLPNVQTAGVGPVKTTAAQLKTFMSASPTLVTPALGVATGTSLALGGATIGSNALAVTGTANISGNATFGGSLNVSSGGQITIGGGTTILFTSSLLAYFANSHVFENMAGSAASTLTIPASGSWQFGAADASSAVAQTLQFQSSTGAATTGPTSTIVLAGGVSASGKFQIQKKVNGTPTTILDWGVTTADVWTFAGTALFNNDISIASGRSILFAGNAYIDTAAAGEYRFQIGSVIKFRLDISGFWPNTANAIDVGLVGNEVRYVRAYNLSTKPVAVGSLPAAATAGSGTRAFVNDALTPVYGSTVTGGGAAKVPVYSDGTNWIVG